MALKYSRQREAIKEFLMTTKEHPTADTVYMNVRKEFPNISLGTVYRNLSLLADIGEITRLSLGDGTDHFDGTTAPHYHFICMKCNSVSDLEIDSLDAMNKIAEEKFNGLIDGHVTYFYGKCENCHKKSVVTN